MKKMKRMNTLFAGALAIILSVSLVSCSDDDNSSAETYNTQIKITDSPVDDAEVEAVFITVADVQLDGRSLEGFSKTTIELSALTNGDTQLLGNLDLEAGDYSNLKLILDTQTDAAGNAPANYVTTQSNGTVALTVTNPELQVNETVSVLAQAGNVLVIDFDLRKALVAKADGTYDFAVSSQLSNSLRVSNTLQSGMIQGTANSTLGGSNRTIIAFAYEQGTFTEADAEANANGVRFANAVTSSVTTGTNNQFSLHFLEAGNYEVQFASFVDDNNDGRLEFEGRIETSSNTAIELNNISVGANTTTTLDLSLLAVLGL